MGLTEREAEVLTWVAEGNRDVGIILEIKSATVKKHLEHIFRKIGVETRTAAVVFALRAARHIAKKTVFVPFVYYLNAISCDVEMKLTLLVQLAVFE